MERTWKLCTVYAPFAAKGFQRLEVNERMCWGDQTRAAKGMRSSIPY